MATNSVTKIELQYLPAIYPVVGFVDRFSTINRAVRRGQHEARFMTTERYKVVADNFYEQRLIQLLSYDRYELKLQVQESAGVEAIRQADSVTITLMDGTVHKAKVLEISEPELLGATENRVYTISYYDVNPLNYRAAQPVSDFLKSTFLRQRYDDSQLTQLNITALQQLTNFANAGWDYTLYTSLQPTFSTSEVQEEPEKVLGIERPTVSISQDTLQMVFYLDHTEALVAQKYLPRCDGFALRAKAIYSGGYELAALERILPTVEVVEGAVDLYKCTVNLKYYNHIIYPYKD